MIDRSMVEKKIERGKESELGERRVAKESQV
jgi:hypothetical protein